MENPYIPPQAILEESTTSMTKQYGGIRRLPYFGIMLLFMLLFGLAGNPVLAQTFLILFFIPIYYRMKNIGMSPWWCLTMLIPIIYLLIGIHCLAFPEGYQDTSKLDNAGRIIIFVILGIILIPIFVIVVFLSIRP
jgi:uncharacterized membrane protein YhaH (DUF805 family)